MNGAPGNTAHLPHIRFCANAALRGSRIAARRANQENANQFLSICLGGEYYGAERLLTRYFTW